MSKIIVGYNKCRISMTDVVVCGTWIYDTCKDKVYYKKGKIEGLKEGRCESIAKYPMCLNEDRQFFKLGVLKSDFIELSLFLNRISTDYRYGYVVSKDDEIYYVENECIDTGGVNKYFLMLVWSRSRMQEYSSSKCDLSLKSYREDFDSPSGILHGIALPEIVYWRLIYLASKKDYKAILGVLPMDIRNLLYYHYVIEDNDIGIKDFKIKSIK